MTTFWWSTVDDAGPSLIRPRSSSVN